MHYLFLTLAILSEVTATTALKGSKAFTKPGPSVVVVLGYCAAFYFLSRCIETLNLGVAYAIWSGLGIVLVTVLAWKLYDQSLDVPALVGIGLIVIGVVVLQLFSNTVTSGE